MSTGAKLLPKSIFSIRGIYYFCVVMHSNQQLDCDYATVLDCRTRCLDRAPINTQVIWNHSSPWWLSNTTNGVALGPPMHNLSVQFSSVLPLASSHLKHWNAVYLSQEVTACLRIILSPSPLLHIPSGPLSSRSTELLHIVTDPTMQCFAVSWILPYCKDFYFW